MITKQQTPEGHAFLIFTIQSSIQTMAQSILNLKPHSDSILTTQ